MSPFMKTLLISTGVISGLGFMALYDRESSTKYQVSESTARNRAPELEELVKDEIGASHVTRVESNSLAYINSQPVTSPAYRVQVTFNTGLMWGGGQDFNGLAGSTMRAADNAFRKAPALEWIRFDALEESGKNWAIVEVKRSELPLGWSSLTYLQKMSHVSLVVPYVQPRKWLCEFYKKYPSATARRDLQECPYPS